MFMRLGLSMGLSYGARASSVAATIVTPGASWTGANTAATATPSLAYYGADTSGFATVTASATPHGTGLDAYQINAQMSWAEYCWYVDDDNCTGIIWGSVGADQVNGRLDYVDFYFEDDTPTRLSTIEWDSSIGAFGVRVNLRAPADRNGVARWYARCVPVNGLERVISGTVWLNSRSGQTGYIDRDARSITVDPAAGSDAASRGTPAAPYATLEYALPNSKPTATAPDKTNAAATREGGYIYLVGNTHLLDGTNLALNASTASILPCEIRAHPDNVGDTVLTRSVRQVEAQGSPNTGTYGAARFVATATGNTMTVTEVWWGTLHRGMRTCTAAMSTGNYIRSQLTSDEPGGALGGRGTYDITYGTGFTQTVVTGCSAINLQNRYIHLRGLSIDAAKIPMLSGGSSGYIQLLVIDCDIADADGSLGPVDGNARRYFHRAQGTNGNSLVSALSGSTARGTGVFNTTFDCPSMAGFKKYVNVSGVFSWDALLDSIDAGSRKDLTIFNYRARKDQTWKGRIHDAADLTLAAAPTYNSGSDTTTLVFEGEGCWGDNVGQDVGVLFTSGALAGTDSWNSSNTATANTTAITHNTTNSSATITVTALVGKLFPGMRITGTNIPAETHILSQSSGTSGGTGDYVLTKAATATASGTTGGLGFGCIYSATIRGDYSGAAAGDTVRLYATGHGDAMQTNQSNNNNMPNRENWVIQGYEVVGVDLQLALAQMGSKAGTGTCSSTGTALTLSTAQILYAGDCIRVSATSWAFIDNSGNAGTSASSFTLTGTGFTGGNVGAGTSFTIGNTINGASIANAFLGKSKADTADNYGVAIGAYNDNIAQIQQGLRNFSYGCSTLLGLQSSGAHCLQFRPTQSGFGLDGFALKGVLTDYISSDTTFPASGFAADAVHVRVVAGVPASGMTNTSSGLIEVDMATMKLAADYAGETVTSEIATAFPFDIAGNVRRVGDPVGALARVA